MLFIGFTNPFSKGFYFSEKKGSHLEEKVIMSAYFIT